MKIRNLVGLIIQLMAIQFLLRLLLNWQVAGFALGSPPLFSNDGSFNPWPYRIYFAAGIIVSVFLCAFAKDIAARLIATEETISLGNLTIVDAYTIAFFVVAISFIFGSIVEVVYFAAEFLRIAMTPNSFEKSFEFWTLLRTFVPPIIGFAFLLNARSLATTYARKQDLIARDATETPPPAAE